MKKNIALLLGLVLGLGFVSCSNDDDDEKGTYLAEKSITIYEWKDGKRPSEGKLYQLYKYNEKEQLISQESPFFGYRQTPIYDANGECIEQRFYNYRTDEYIGVDKREYNRADSVFIIYSYNWKDKLVSTTKFEYTYGDKLKRETEIIDSIGKDHGKVWTYSYNGNIKTVDVTNLKDGSLIEKQVYELDNYGNATKFTRYNYYFQTSPIIDEYEFKYAYDSQGKLLKASSSDGYTEYTYNADGTLKKEHEVYNISETTDYEYTYTYKKK